MTTKKQNSQSRKQLTKGEQSVILKIYSIRDSKGECYNQPWFQKTHGEAERNFKQLCHDEKSMVFKYPDDYDLYFLGHYDDQTGVIKPLDTPQHIAKAAALKLV